MKRILRAVVIGLMLATLIGGCVRTDSSINSPDDAKNKKIGVMTGSIGETLAHGRFPNAEIKSFDDVMDAVAAIKSGQIDAIVTMYPTALQVTKKNTDLRLLSENLENENTAVAVRKDDAALLAEVNRIIAELDADGSLGQMRKRWLKTDLSPYEEVTIAVPKEGEVLKVGVSATREPLSFVDANGKVSGLDGELARVIGARLKRPVEFLNMKFMALIPALQSGKVDMIVSGMNATPERSKSVSFSRNYFNNAQVMIVRNMTGAAPASSVVAGTKVDSPLAAMKQTQGRRIGVLTGSAGDLAARKHFPKAVILDMNAAADAALAVKTNKADAFVYDKSVLLNLAEKNPELVIMDEPVAQLEVAAAIKKENGALLEEVNRVMAALKQDGTLRRLREKWIDAKDSGKRVLPPESAKPVAGVLRMGTFAIIEPFAYQENGKLTGLDVELGRLIAERLGKRLEIHDMQFEALIPALQSGKIDFAMSNFNVTEERKKLVNFSLPYIENDISALVRRADYASAASGGRQQSAKITANLKLSKPEDVQDKRVGVLLGSEHDRYVMRTFPKATVLQYKTPSDMLLAVKSGKVDAGLYTRETLVEIMRVDADLGLVGESLYPVPIAMGFRKGNDDLRQEFNAFLKEIRKNGVYADMVDRWMKRGDSAMPDIQNRGDRGVLVVATVSDKGMPFAMMKDNQLIGFDTELCQRFAAHIGKRLQFADMEFGGLIAAVSTGKVDMVASTLMVTEERKKQIDFSDVYYEMGSSVFALKNNIASIGADGNVAPVAPTFLQGLATSFHSNIILEKRYLLIWDGLQVTFLIAVLSSIFGTMLGALICFMRMSARAIWNVPAKIYISVLRGTPVLVLLMLIFYVVFASVNINPVMVAIIAFGMNFAAYASEIFRTGIESVDRGQTEAGIAMGFTPLNTFRFIILPQAIRHSLPVYKGEFISLVKMTSIVGYIAVQDLTKASDIIRSRTFDAFFPLVMVAVLYFMIAWALTQSLEYLERMTDPKRKRKGGKS